MALTNSPEAVLPADEPGNTPDRSAALRDQMGILTPDDLCAVLGIEPQTLAIWRVRGIGPDFVKGDGTKAVFYRRKDVEAWLAVNVVPTNRTARAA